MALKKPSDFFHDKNKNASENLDAEIDSGNKKLVLESANSYKSNSNKTDVISNFTETLETFKNNVEKVSVLSEEVESIQEEIKNFLTREDLNNTLLSHLMSVDQTIQDIQKNVKTINSKSLLKIKEEFSTLTDSINEFLDEEAPKYKKFILDSEIRNDLKFNEIKFEVDEKINQIDQLLDIKFHQVEENLEGINEEYLNEFNEKIHRISSEVKNLVKKELPKYNNLFVESEIKTEKKISSAIESFKDELDSKTNSIKESLRDFISSEIPKYNTFLVESKIKTENEIKSIQEELNQKLTAIDSNINFIEQKLDDKSKDINNIVGELQESITLSLEELNTISVKYNNLFKDFKNRENYNDEKLQSYSKTLDTFSNKVSDVQEKLSSNISEIEDSFNVKNDLVNKNIQDVNNSLKSKIKDLELNIVVNESHIKKQNENLNEIKNEIHSVISKLKIDFIESQNKKLTDKIKHIEEVFNKFNEKTILAEESSLLTQPPSTKTQDPLTPVDQKFVTFDDLATHYRRFINRVQIQMASIGGGGAGFIKDLDDVEFDQTTGNGKLLIYDQANSKWVGIASTALGGGGGGGGGESYWVSTSAGIHTLSNVGIGTTNPEEKLHVLGNIRVDGNISVAGTVTYDDVTNVDSIGVVTAREDVRVGRNLSVVGITTLGSSNGIGTVTIGIGNTALYVDGDARVIGILTVGRGSVTIDGETNTITAGIVTITNSTIFLGDNITLSGNSSGINSAPNVIYVAKDGNDNHNGTSIDNAKLTISGAVGIATTGTIIKVLAGNYLENNPIEVPPFVSIVGDDLKTVTVTPNTAHKDIFHVRKGCYISGMTFTNHVSPAAAVGFPTSEIATNVGGGSWESPYIQNCTSNTTTGVGLRVDGAQAEGLKSIVCDSFTQYNQGGVGVAITNKGFAQLVSLFTICCNEAITCHKGGQADLTNSNSSFGTYGLVADGVSDLQFTGVVTSVASISQDNVVVSINTTTRPYDGQLVYFDKLYNSIETITVSAGGTGYTSTPTVTVSSPSGPNGETATAFATIENGSVTSVTLISSGSQYESVPTITISAPNIGINTATAVASVSPIYYTINSSTPVTSGITTLTLDENLLNTVSIGTTAYFYQVSRIVASSHTFEYVGSGNTISSAIPNSGGVTVQQNEVVTTNGGKVVYTSTDQSGNFRIGDELQINQNTGTISGRAFTRSLFSEMTPFILALS